MHSVLRLIVIMCKLSMNLPIKRFSSAIFPFPNHSVIKSLYFRFMWMSDKIVIQFFASDRYRQAANILRARSFEKSINISNLSLELCIKPHSRCYLYLKLNTPTNNGIFIYGMLRQKSKVSKFEQSNLCIMYNFPPRNCNQSLSNSNTYRHIS